MIWGCENIDVCWTRIGFQVLGPAQQYEAFSVIRRLGYSVYVGGEKNGLRRLRLYQARMVRSQTALGAGFVVWRLSNLLGDRGTPNRLPAVQQGEAREAGEACGQSVLQQAVCLFCGTALPGHDDQRRGSRNPSGLEDDQGVRQAVHARAVTQDRNSGAQGHWNRRNFHTQGTHLSHRGQRSFASPADLVWWQGPLGTKHR